MAATCDSLGLDIACGGQGLEVMTHPQAEDVTITAELAATDRELEPVQVDDMALMGSRNAKLRSRLRERGA